MVRRKRTLYHIGYESENVADFVSRLMSVGITTLVDVRQLPLSRKPGFSKNQLASRLEREGIKYVHAESLGTPILLRKELRADGNYLVFFNKYRAYLKKKHLEIQKLIGLAEHETVCIMCFEKDCELCHRTIVADEIMRENPFIQIMAA